MRTEARGLSLLNEPSEIERPEIISSAVTPTFAAPTPIVRYAVLVGLSVGGLVWDLWSKWAVFDAVPPGNVMRVWNGPVFGMPIQFDLATTFNHGALWGFGQGLTWFFATLSFVAVAVIAYFVWTRQAISTWWLTIASGFLLAGTLGNLYDRMGMHGWRDGNNQIVYAVRDFLDVIFNNGGLHWATFNFADTYLVTGAIMLALQSFWTPQPPAPTPKAH